MQVDALTLAAVADEWRTLLKGARIDTIIQPTEYSIALQCYAPGGLDAQGNHGGRNRWVYLSAHPQLARAHITARKPAKITSEPPPFVMLLRKYLEGTRIETIEQPRYERILEVVVGYRSAPESDERVRFRLIVEIMGRVSNIILCDTHGIILGSLKRVGPEVNRYRVIAPGVAYVPPPPQHRIVAGQSLPRLDPATVTASQLFLSAEGRKANQDDTSGKKGRRRAGEEPKLWQLLSENVLGMSPLLAREAVYCTTEDAEVLLNAAAQATWEELAWNVRDLAALYETQRWRPQLVERIEPQQQGSMAREGDATPLAFAVYTLEQYAGIPGVRIEESPSINVILDDYYARTEWRDALEDLRSPIRKALQAQRDRCLRKGELLQQELTVAEEAATYRLQAELLLAHQNEVQQGQTSIDLPNVFESEGEGALVTITLDPRFDAVGNANRLFTKYRKLRRAIELVPEQIEQNDIELATTEQLLADLALAETPAEVELVKAEVQSAGYMRGRAVKQDKKAQKAAKKSKGKQGKSGRPPLPGGGVPLHVQSRDGFTILVGKNSRQNEEVTFRQGTSSDIWLHARGVPGSHIIIKGAGREVPRSTLEQAARLAAYYSQARGSTSVPVDYTLQRYVKHMKGGGPGMVIYDHEKTMYAEPAGIES